LDLLGHYMLEHQAVNRAQKLVLVASVILPELAGA